MLGKTFLHYKITVKLGSGGMGVVYLADDQKLNRQVALKFLSSHLSAEEREIERFRNEARTAAALNNPNIAQIYAIEEAEEQTFIVMEYVDGVELRDYIQDSEPTLEDKAEIAIRVAEGLRAAHDKDILHRDIKSGNIMINNKGRVKIMDFGLARIADSAHITKTGHQLGTTAYMSPEQLMGMEADYKTDIWSYGIVLYELYTGEMPFDGLYEQAITYAILDEEPKSLDEFENIPPNIRSVINRCLEKDPGSRYESFEEILNDLQDEAFKYKKKKSGKKRKGLPELNPLMRYGIPAFILLIAATLFFMESGSGLIRADNSTSKLAIIPFTNIGSDESNRVLLDGVLETMTSKLSQIDNYQESLWVIPSSEIIANDIQSASQANKLFNVNLVITGSLQNIGEQKRLTINLVDAKTLRQIRSTVIDISDANLSGLQTESVLQLIDLLEIENSREIERTLTAGTSTEPGANEFYLNGLGYLLRFGQGNNLDNAIQLFKQAVEADDNYALAYAALGESYWLKYEDTDNTTYVDSARKSLDQATAIDADLTEVKLTMALLNLGTGNTSLAIKLYNDVLEQDPRNDIAIRGLGDAYQSQQDLEKAEEYYKQAIALKPDYWGGYEKLGSFYMSISEYEKALEPYRQVIRLTPNNHIGYSNLGAAFYFLNNWPQAGEYFKRSFEIQPTENAASNLGTVYYIEGKYELAAEQYRNALEINPNNYSIWGNLASVNGIMGNTDKEQEYYQSAIDAALKQLQVNPDDMNTTIAIGTYYSDLGDENNATTYLEKALELGSDYGNIVFRAASAYERLGLRDRAIVLMEDALNLGFPLVNIINQPELEDLVKDERFADVISRTQSD